jgi:hypothetical protein
MEVWELLVGIGAVLTPVVLAAFARDRSLLQMISATKDDAGKMITKATDPLHERINRVRDEFVRRDDLAAHLERVDKQFDDLRAEVRRSGENTDRKLDEIRRTLSPGIGKSPP